MDPLKHLEELTKDLIEPVVTAKVLHALLDITADAYWIWHVPSGYDYLSDGWQRILGYSPDELPHHYETWRNLLSEADYGRARKCVEDHLNSQGKTPYDVQFHMRQKSGKQILVRATGAVISWENGRAIIMAGKLMRISDATERL